MTFQGPVPKYTLQSAKALPLEEQDCFADNRVGDCMKE
jgi:hypothetical protein